MNNKIRNRFYVFEFFKIYVPFSLSVIHIRIVTVLVCSSQFKYETSDTNAWIKRNN